MIPELKCADLAFVAAKLEQIMAQTRKPAPTSTLTIILAAGEGTRMRSDKPKVLHEIAGRSLLGHVLSQTGSLDENVALAVVIGPNREDVAAEVRRHAPHAEIFIQTERRGTAHAVLAAKAAIARGYGRVQVAFADMPLVLPTSWASLHSAMTQGADLVVIGFQAHDPTGYGRLLIEGDRLQGIIEHKDANPAQRAITACNSGLMALRGDTLLSILESIGSQNAQGEFYMTDAVALAVARGQTAKVVFADETEVMGVNDKAQLAQAEAIMQKRLRAAAMTAGVTMMAPDSVHLAHDTEFGRNVTLEPNLYFGKGVVVGDNAVIHAFSHLEGATIGTGAHVGPFARLRPGTVLHASAKVGNFVEIKASEVETGAKISHLSYIGDARVGAHANIGAGVITCNYDGYLKYRTDIGENAFIGSNSSLVAPVTVGNGAIVGSGSVITQNVAANALALARSRQVEKPGWAQFFSIKMRERLGKGKKQ